MPGRTPREAVEAYAQPIRETLACITNAILGYDRRTSESQPYQTLRFISNPPVGKLNGTKLKLFFSQQYSVIQQSEGDQNWKVKTRGYIYRVDDEDDDEILSYHWHPFGELPKHPHMHLKKGSGVSRTELTRGHIPTGRMAIESLALYLIAEFGVQPRTEECTQTIRRNLDIFERHRTWA